MKRERDAAVLEDPGEDAAVQAVPDEVPVDDGVAPGSKPDRLAVAQEAVAEGIRKEASSAAKRQARYRANNLERVREREKLRKARVRKR